MKRWGCLVFLVWLGVPVLALANPVTMNDFAYGLKIRVPAGVAVAAVSVPEPVYKTVYRVDLGDIRVFNADGEPVPHLLRFAQSQSAQTPWRQLPYFPIPDDGDGSAADYGVYVRTGPDGTIVRIQPQTQQTQSQSSTRTILIDLSQMDINLAELRLDWQPGTMNRMVFLSVEASDDLVDWTRLKSRAVISDIQYGGHRLGNNTITFSPTLKPYLRLRQLNEGPPIAVRSIQGRSIAEGPNPVRAVLTVAGRQADEAKGGYVYDTGGAFPVDRVNLVFDQPNSMADAQLASRHHRQREWRNRCSGLFYRIDVQGTALTSAPQPVTATMDRYWWLTVNASESTIGQSIPRLEIGYRPHDLFFIARGHGPFTLAFGSTRAEPLKTNVATLVDSINRQQEHGIERWVFPDGTVFELGGASRLTPQSKPLPTRQLVLWSVLLGGVLIVAMMAWRLACRLKP
ncbi:transmembrane protein associated with glutamine ABC transporter [Desulfosarcina variabilis str. Montpellier]|uniref:DUF3999 domain-containing protein n=1 Tax=Desulfosarcina variabilis TaxID=2300 RepID=UPI003AFA1731